MEINKGQSKQCKVCGKVFYQKPSESARYWKTKKYCGIKCAAFDRRGIPTWNKRSDGNPKRHSTELIFCACGCGQKLPRYDYRGREHKYINGHKSREVRKEMAKKTSLAMKGNPKMLAHIKDLAEKHIGKNHWNWKGGIAWKQCERQTPKYKEWAMAVYRKDHFTCQDCNTHCKTGDIVAHHKKSWEHYPELRYDVDNGITLCRSCHKIRHKEIGLAYRFKTKDYAKLETRLGLS